MSRRWVAKSWSREQQHFWSKSRWSSCRLRQQHGVLLYNSAQPSLQSAAFNFSIIFARCAVDSIKRPSYQSSSLDSMQWILIFYENNKITWKKSQFIQLLLFIDWQTLRERLRELSENCMRAHNEVASDAHHFCFMLFFLLRCEHSDAIRRRRWKKKH